MKIKEFHAASDMGQIDMIIKILNNLNSTRQTKILGRTKTIIGKLNDLRDSIKEEGEVTIR